MLIDNEPNKLVNDEFLKFENFCNFFKRSNELPSINERIFFSINVQSPCSEKKYIDIDKLLENLKNIEISDEKISMLNEYLHFSNTCIKEVNDWTSKLVNMISNKYNNEKDGEKKNAYGTLLQADSFNRMISVDYTKENQFSEPYEKFFADNNIDKNIVSYIKKVSHILVGINKSEENKTKEVLENLYKDFNEDEKKTMKEMVHLLMLNKNLNLLNDYNLNHTLEWDDFYFFISQPPIILESFVEDNSRRLNSKNIRELYEDYKDTWAKLHFNIIDNSDEEIDTLHKKIFMRSEVRLFEMVVPILKDLTKNNKNEKELKNKLTNYLTNKTNFKNVNDVFDNIKKLLLLSSKGYDSDIYKTRVNLDSPNSINTYNLKVTKIDDKAKFNTNKKNLNCELFNVALKDKKLFNVDGKNYNDLYISIKNDNSNNPSSIFVGLMKKDKDNNFNRECGFLFNKKGSVILQEKDSETNQFNSNVGSWLKCGKGVKGFTNHINNLYNEKFLAKDRVYDYRTTTNFINKIKTKQKNKEENNSDLSIIEI